MKRETSRIFISHAGPDSDAAGRVAGRLRDAGLEPILDRERLETGQSFLAFMEEALSTSDFCFLMWSQEAAVRQWVQVEWEAALARSVDEARAFLAVGRLDVHPLPALLKPRLYVDLHPDIEPGLSRLVSTWTADRRAEGESGRPVASKESGAAADGDGDVLYVTSELFGITCPWSADLQAPAGLLLDSLRKRMELPLAHDIEGRIGIRFDYHLAHGDQRLDRGRSLAEQGVEPKSVLWIETEMKVDAAADPVEGKLPVASFRSTKEPPWFAGARDHLLSSIRRAGLGGDGE